MQASQQILSDVIIWSKYAKYIPEIQRREVWDEICDRNQAMHIQKYPQLKKEIKENYKFVRRREVMPSMRSMQFAGVPIELNNSRIFNCAYAAVNDPHVFSEAMFLLLGGTGFGFSVQKHHVEQLPVVQGPSKKTRRFLIGDSIEGWSEAIKVLTKSYFRGKSDPVFDYRDIRHKGARLVTSGGKAPGPDPLRICIDEIRKVLNGAIGRKLTTLECHDIICYIADAVLAGGIRRAALISLFSHDDMDMLSAKSGAWWELNPQRGRANNSAVLHRDTTTYEQFMSVWERVEMSRAGEPGIFWTNDYEIGTNPCAEISLEDCGLCNLTEYNVGDIKTQEELNERSRVAAFLGTLQAGYTDFHYLRPKWKEVAERTALIGVSQTGIGSNTTAGLNLEEAASIVVEENKRVAALIGINEAERCTAVKPSGTAALVFGTSSGVGAWHDEYYIRNVRVGKTEALYSYFSEMCPEFIEDCKFKPHLEAVMGFPQKAPEGAILRSESVVDMLERVKRYNEEWVSPGHIKGVNKHNVSCTVSVKDNEWGIVGEWMWENRNGYTGIATLPYDGGSYVQAPFQTCTKEKYEEMMNYIIQLDLTKVVEVEDNTALQAESACSGGACEVTIL